MVTETHSRKAQSAGKAMVQTIAPEKPIFFENEPDMSVAGFPAEVQPVSRPSSIENANFIMPAPVVAPRPRAKTVKAKSKKTPAKRTRARTSVRKPAQRPKQTAAARAPAVPVTTPQEPVVRPALTRQFDRVTPLPRAAAVTLHRKQSFLDVIGFWLRQRSSGLYRFLASPFFSAKTPKKPRTKTDRLAAENAALRAELARLRAQLPA